jgi:hypothetical protein
MNTYTVMKLLNGKEIVRTQLLYPENLGEAQLSNLNGTKEERVLELEYRSEWTTFNILSRNLKRLRKTQNVSSFLRIQV